MNEKGTENKRTEEVDITDFFRYLGKAINRIGSFIKWIFVSLYYLLIDFFIFLKRKMIWLTLGLVAGLGFGIYGLMNGGALYSSTMTVKSNTGNAYFLYNYVEYLNSLAHNSRFAELSKEFNITTDEATKLISFEIAPVKNDVEEAKMYRDIFYNYKRNHYLSYDTMWARTVRFKDFQKTLTDHDYPLQEITIYSRNVDIYFKVQQGLMAAINNNPELKEKRAAEIEIQKQDEALLTKSLSDLDTLRQVYNRKLALESSQPGTGTNQFVFGDRNARNPELDLYDKSLMIKDELIELKRKLADEKLVDIYSGFSKIGNRRSSVRPLLRYGLYGLGAALAILLFIQFFKYLTVMEKTSRLRRSV
jgi:hypothetical protein